MRLCAKNNAPGTAPKTNRKSARRAGEAMAIEIEAGEKAEQEACSMLFSGGERL